MASGSVILAPGKPGIIPHWTTSAKIGVGTAMTGDSNVWFTLSHGIINEVYYPRVDIANIRDMEFIVTDGKNFFSEEKRNCVHEYQMQESGIPAFHVVNTCVEGRYKIEKVIITDPRRNCLMQRITFKALKGKLEDYHLYLLLAPHINNAGKGNTGWTGDYKGLPMLFANREWVTLACASNVPFLKMTCGYVGTSDAWQDLNKHKVLTNCYNQTEEGNIALAGEIDLKASQGSFVVALGFASKHDEAGLQIRASLFRGFDWTLNEYVDGWRSAQHNFADLEGVDPEGGRYYRVSTAVLKTHEGKHFSGSVIASLSIPWGSFKGDNELGGYHLIWPRDQVMTSTALLASGDCAGSRQTLLFLMCTQEQDGHWSQCMWEDGASYRDGLQLDETALPILLAGYVHRENFLRGIDPFQMVAKAASFIIKNGPVTKEDRWEENEGYTPFTIALEIAALLVAADFFKDRGKHQEAAYLCETADWWYDNIDAWLFVTNTALSNKHGVEGYYVRLRPVESLDSTALEDQQIIIRNRPPGENVFHFADIISVDALALVRYGLRDGNDPRILNTVRLIDEMLLTETPKGRVWHRYNEDSYGDHEDGAPFDGTGVGRGWPLLTGERAHYELARGNYEGARLLLRNMSEFAGTGGLLPEQVWDADDIPEKKLYKGHSAGAAKPLVWAHAEYITLLRSLKEGKVFDMPLQTQQRYLHEKRHSTHAIWRFNDQCKTIPNGKILRIQIENPAKVRWTLDNWNTFHDCFTVTNDLGVHFVDLPLELAPSETKVSFTFQWLPVKKWEDVNYELKVL